MISFQEISRILLASAEATFSKPKRSERAEVSNKRTLLANALRLQAREDLSGGRKKRRLQC
jgi:hypothetical protein